MENNKLSVSGFIQEVLPPVVKSDKFTLKQFILQTDEKIPQSILFQATGTLADKLDTYAVPGEAVTVNFNLSGNEYNGRWYVNLKAWKIVVRTAA